MNISNSMIILTEKFLNRIKNFDYDIHKKINCEPQYKREVLHDIGELLAGGSITSEAFAQIIEKYSRVEGKELIYKPCNLLEKEGIPVIRKPYRDPQNLLIPGQFYYHPRLQKTPPPPVIKVNDDGTFEASYDNEPFYLEMIDRFTLRDLIDYFYLKRHAVCPEVNLLRDKGAFEHMLKFYSVDLVLYLIDEAFAISYDSGKQSPQSPFDVMEYEEQAKAVFEARKKLCFEEGIDRVLAISNT